MAQGHKPNALFGRRTSKSLVRNLQQLAPTPEEDGELVKLQNEVLAELDEAITDVESLTFGEYFAPKSDPKPVEEDVPGLLETDFPERDPLLKNTSIRKKLDKCAEEDFENPFIRDLNYLKKRQSAITNPIYTEEVEYEEYLPLKRVNKSKSVGEKPLFPDRKVEKTDVNNNRKKRRSGASFHIIPIPEISSPKEEVLTKLVVKSKHFSPKEEISTKLVVKSKSSKKVSRKQSTLEAHSSSASFSDDSALGGSLTREELTKGLVAPFVEVDPGGETFFVYPAITVPTPPSPEPEKETVDPFHRFKKKRKTLSSDMTDKGKLMESEGDTGNVNPAFNGENDNSSGYDSNGHDVNGGGHVKNRASYLDAVGRAASVDAHTKSGDHVGAFRPGSGSFPGDDMADMHAVCDSDDDSVRVIKDTDGMLEFNPNSKQALKDRSSKWDVFREIPLESGHETREIFFAGARQVFKMVTYVFLFLAVLGLAVVSKGTLLLVTSNIRHSNSFRLECVDYEENGNVFSKCVELPINAKPQPPREIRPCLEAGNGTGNLTQITQPYTKGMCDVMIVQWVWCLLLIICTPYIFTFIRNLWMVCFKSKKAPSGRVLGIAVIVETFHVVGVAMFAFRVLPLLNNVVQGLIVMCAVALVPSILKVINRPRRTSAKFNVLYIILDALAVAGQISALIVWPIVAATSNNWHKDLAWSIPVSLILISVKYWENYVDEHTRLGALKPVILRLAKDLRRARTKIQLLCSIWKVGCMVLLMMAFLSMEGITVREMFNFNEGDCDKNSTISYTQIPSLRLDWVFIWIVNFAAAFVCYFCARSAIKIQMQIFSFAIPLTLSSPILLGLLIGGCEGWTDNPCTFVRGAIPGHFFFKCWARDGLNDAARDEHWWLLALWWLSQFWLTWHIWFPKLARLANTDKVFVQPLYDGMMLEQSLIYNLTRNVKRQRTARQSLATLAGYPDINGPSYDDIDFSENEESHNEKLLRMKDETPLIYICATMWHENDQEMIMLLKSIGRLDIDQCARRNAQDHLGIIDPDYYEFEAHIFFDDCMENRMADDYDYQVNSFVKLLCTCMSTGISAVHESNIIIPDPIKYPTPYGGRLEWTLPGGNKIICHLKDKMKIRHKKRWSQVMYMYYFLGHRLWSEEMGFKRKELRADNTYLLALDGDVDFEPLALQLLVDLMKRNDKVGAACGRIHPIGSGPMVWYQKFEYALGHWMQKATEHVLGCVLCSPGCFSLFRGSALMDDNVMRKYTTLPTEAAHYVQYDQGEDRWLCTLLLQQGYRVEYCAASDSFTFAPEGFNEFYNQRRRWMPSTMANILDLLMSWQHTIRMNENISFIYIVYQTVIFVFSLLGPGTIFLMITGALTVALNNAIDLWVSLFINLVPLVIFIILCYTTKPDTQLAFASIMTAIYALVQMLVLVGIIIQIAGQGPCSPTAVFFFYTAGTFIFSAIIHPQEFFCVVHGFIYFLAIPSMYMLLMIYSLCNLNVVSWGTREVKQTKTEKEVDEAMQMMEQEKNKKKDDKSEALSGLLSMIKGQKKEEGTLCRWGACCSCLCCPKEVEEKEDLKFNAILNKLEIMENNMSELQEEVDEVTGKEPAKHKASVTSIESYRPRGLSFNDEIAVIPEEPAEPEEEIDELINPKWIEDEDLGCGPMGRVSQKEIMFFQDLITTYLYPLDKDKATEERVAMELADLKNKMSFAFLLANAIFVVVMFTLQMNTGTLSIPWPCGENLRIEPLGFFFLCFFAVIMFIQTIGMVTHRMTTFLHICATTTLTWFDTKEKKSDDVKNSIELAKNMAALKDDDDAASIASTAHTDDDGDDGRQGMRRTKTVRKIAKAKTIREKNEAENINKSMDAAFTRRLEKLSNQLDYENNTAEEIGKSVLGRKDTGLGRRKSVSAIKFLQSRRDRDGRPRGLSNASGTVKSNKPKFNTSRSLDDVERSIKKAPLAPSYSLDVGSYSSKPNEPRMSIVNEDGESSFYEDLTSSKDKRPALPPKPKPRPDLELNKIVIEENETANNNTDSRL